MNLDPTLLSQMKALPDRPFLRQVVQSPWDAVIDQRSLHSNVRELIQKVLSECKRLDAIRALTIVAPSGYGKTHLLTWLRYHCHRYNNLGLFVYITPYIHGSEITFEQHLLRNLTQAIYHRTMSQQRMFKEAVIRFVGNLVHGATSAEELLDDLETETKEPEFLERAFAEFGLQHPPTADGVRLHRDTFIAILLMLFAKRTVAWAASRWLEGEAIAPLPMHTFPAPLQGSEEIRDAIYTIVQMANIPLCLAFDQMEDTTISVVELGFAGWLDISSTLRSLFTIPRVCTLFFFQLSAWSQFAMTAPPMLVDRMVEGYGVQILQPLNDTQAMALIAERMRTLVWEKLKLPSPVDDPLFPFTAERVREMRINAGGEIRGFLRLAHEQYERILNGEPPVPKVPLQLKEITAAADFRLEHPKVLILGDGLPKHADVYFGDRLGLSILCRPAEGQIEAVVPKELKGEMEVTVRDRDNPTVCAVITFNLDALTAAPKPYRHYIDRQKLRKRREQLGWTLADVSSKVGFSPAVISNLENGKTKNPNDEIFEKLAKEYGCSLRELQLESVAK